MGNNGKGNKNYPEEFELENDNIEDFYDEALSIINISSNKKFLKWVHKVQKEKNFPIEYDDEEILNDVEAFYVPAFTDEESVKEFFNDYGEDIFNYMFAAIFKDLSVIPEYHGVDSLYEYFEISVDDYIRSFEDILNFLEDLENEIE